MKEKYLLEQIKVLQSLLDEAYDIINGSANPAWEDWCNKVIAVEDDTLDESQNDLYELYGLRNDYEPGYGDRQGSMHETRELIATFDNEKLAKEYVKKSELKNPDRSDYKYRSSSLLRYYDDFEIVLHIPEVEYPPIHNPVL